MYPNYVEISPEFLKKTFMYPGRLTWLAMDSLGTYVSSLFKMLVEKKDDHLVKKVCGYLQNMLHDNVPNRLTEELKIRILRKFEDTYLQMRDMYKSEDENLEIAVDLFVAIVHESATSIECANQDGHLDLLDAYRMRFLDIIYSALPRLENLRVLRLYWSILCNREIEVDSFPPNLEECSLSMASDKEIARLYRCCKKLKVLDIDGQSYVSEYCVYDLLQLEHLERLHYVSHVNTDMFLAFESKKRVCGKNASTFLKRFACSMSGLGHECIESIPIYSPNLVSLTLINVNYDLSPLKALSHLKQFSVRSKSYVHLRNLFSSIGNQLTCLTLSFINDVDLEHVEKNCSSVSCLHLIECPDTVFVSDREEEYEYTFEPSNVVVPKFPQVTRLQLSYEEYFNPVVIHLLSGFINVKKLQLHNWYDDEILDAIVKRGATRNLEEAILSAIYGPIITLVFSEKYVVITESAFRSAEGVRVRSMPLAEYL